MPETPTPTIRQAQWPTDEAALEQIRRRVFIDEQGVPQPLEWDGRDAQALHVIAEHQEQAIGCGRLLEDGRIGRLAVLRDWRGQGLGRQLLSRLVELAQARGDLAVYLHAQAEAVDFYARAGFDARGEPFDEAGIAHLAMWRDLDYSRWNQPLLRIGYPRPANQVVLAQAHLATRELRILSPRLDPRLFDQEALSVAIRALVRRGRMSRVKILVRDIRALIDRGHGLLGLAHRLPTGIEMRCLKEHPGWDDDTLMIRDRDSVLALPAGEEEPAVYRPQDRARAASAVDRFEELWRSGETDPEFRALAL